MRANKRLELESIGCESLSLVVFLDHVTIRTLIEMTDIISHAKKHTMGDNYSLQPYQPYGNSMLHAQPSQTNKGGNMRSPFDDLPTDVIIQITSCKDARGFEYIIMDDEDLFAFVSSFFDQMKMYCVSVKCR